jgi:hypothetical protein
MPDERTNAPCRGQRSRNLRDGEVGFALIEVLVSAALVMVIATAVLGGIDVPSMISGRDQASSQGASIAQQDQERMRGMSVASLINLNQTRTQTVDNRAYTVTSKVNWVTDSGSSLSCSSGDSQSGDYLKLNSTVTGPSIKYPVVLESLLAPPNGSLATKKGNLGVLITDQAGAPVQGATVSISGPQSGSASSDANGCVFFALINPGSYQTTVSKTGYVDKGGNSSVVQTSTVSAGSTSLLQPTIGKAVSITVNLETNAYGTVKASSRNVARTVTIANAQLLPSGTKTANVAANASSTTINNLYPFTDGYSAYSGNCATANPVGNSSPVAGPYVTNPVPAPGGSGSVLAREPALNLTVTVMGASPGVAGTADIHSTNGCGNFDNQPLTSGGQLVSTGFPAGTYNVCVEGNVPSFGGTYHVVKTGVVLNNFTSGNAVAIDGNSGNAQPNLCPAVFP